MKQIDPILYLLTSLVIFFTVLLLLCAEFLTSDGQTFQVISGCVTGFAGALLMRVKPPTDLPPGSVATTQSQVKTITPPVPAEPVAAAPNADLGTK